MGFFGKRGEDKPVTPQHEEGDFSDSPMEQVSLAAKPAAPAPAPQPIEEERPNYGIDQAIELMRALPPSSEQNVELVVAIIKTTLESLKVRVTDIIEDASRKQKRLEDRVTDLKREIGDFEKEILTRKDEIGRLEADHSETTSVKARLELAEKAQKAAQKPKVLAAATKTGGAA
jgi:phage shock protein A